MRDGSDTAARERWAAKRRGMETADERYGPDHRHHIRKWKIFKALVWGLKLGLICAGLYRRGVRNALDLRLQRLELAFDGLPAAFDGYTVLHMTDLHCDGLPEAIDRAAGLIADLEVDLCVLTGDYRFRVHGPYEPVMPGLRRLMGAVNARDGTFATLGNHDTADMAGPIEEAGAVMLVNETQTLRRGDAVLLLTGIDDVHYYYTEAADAALYDGGDGFRIALVHSPEFVEQAAAAGTALYLTGHTHGGQVCLPGGRPIITHAGKWRCYASGLWRHGAMVGYTGSGVGISGMPVRFNNRGEVTLITLRSRAAEIPQQQQTR